MQRFSQLIFKQINATLATAGATIALALWVYGFAQVSISQRHAESHLISQAIGVSRAAATEGNALLIQPALERFVTDWNQTEPLEARTEIELDGSLVAKAGQAQPFKRFFSSVSERIALPSGSTLQIRIDLAKGSYWLQVLFEIVALELLVLALFLLLKRKIGRVVSEISEPLEDTARWIQAIAHGLPDSAKKLDGLKESRIYEVESVRQSVVTLAREIAELEEKLTRTSYDRGRLQMAHQVVHDIRSPMSTLDMWLTCSKSVTDEEKERVRGPIRRIQDIINTLLTSRRQDLKLAVQHAVELAVEPSETLPTLVLPFIEQVISEKRLQYSKRPELKIEGPEPQDCYSICSQIEPTAFQRMLSNLIDNAVEAIADDGWVIVKVAQNAGRVVIEVSDTGKGMTGDEVTRVLNFAESIAKPSGNGMGLKHARALVRSWQGDFTLESTPMLGTTIRLSLAQARLPVGLQLQLNLSGISNVVVVDDDPTIHALWKFRWRTLGLSDEIVLTHVSKPSDLVVLEPSLNTLYLVDYDLGAGEISGIDLVRTRGMSRQSILVTSRYDEPKLAAQCENLELRRIPKSWAAFMPIRGNLELKKASGDPIRQGEDVFALLMSNETPNNRGPSEVDV